jgi:hypothetical protein
LWDKIGVQAIRLSLGEEDDFFLSLTVIVGTDHADWPLITKEVEKFAVHFFPNIGKVFIVKEVAQLFCPNPSMVSIPNSSGTGFCISYGYGLTCKHVFKNASNVSLHMSEKIDLRFNRYEVYDPTKHSANGFYRAGYGSVDHDVAFFRIDTESYFGPPGYDNFSSMTVLSKHNVRPTRGMKVQKTGAATGRTLGIIESVNQFEIIISSAQHMGTFATHGDSGAPVYDMTGHFLGVVIRGEAPFNVVVLNFRAFKDWIEDFQFKMIEADSIKYFSL